MKLMKMKDMKHINTIAIFTGMFLALNAQAQDTTAVETNAESVKPTINLKEMDPDNIGRIILEADKLEEFYKLSSRKLITSDRTYDLNNEEDLVAINGIEGAGANPNADEAYNFIQIKGNLNDGKLSDNLNFRTRFNTSCKIEITITLPKEKSNLIGTNTTETIQKLEEDFTKESLTEDGLNIYSSYKDENTNIYKFENKLIKTSDQKKGVKEFTSVFYGTLTCQSSIFKIEPMNPSSVQYNIRNYFSLKTRYDVE